MRCFAHGANHPAQHALAGDYRQQFGGLGHHGGIRPDAEMELSGMDLPEMGSLAYPEFEGSFGHG